MNAAAPKNIFVGEVVILDKLFKVWADINSDSSQILQYYVEPCFIRIPGKEEYRFVIPVTPTMIEEFNAISQKYKEWSKVAIDNKAEVERDMDIETPIRKSLERNYSKFEEYNVSIKPFFKYIIKKAPTLAFSVSAHDKYHPNYFYLIFSDPEQLDNFIAFLDPISVLNKIRTGNIGSLFK